MEELEQYANYLTRVLGRLITVEDLIEQGDGEND